MNKMYGHDYRDPSEAIWQEYFKAALTAAFAASPTAASTVAEAKNVADKAFAEHCERWPRERKVVPLTEHEERLAIIRVETAERVLEAIGGGGAQFVVYNLENAKRHDAANVLRAFIEGLGSIIGRANSRLFVTEKMTWSCPPPYEPGDFAWTLPKQAIPMLHRLLVLGEQAQSASPRWPVNADEKNTIGEAVQVLRNAIFRSQ
jgi:hypothetical protein